MLRAKELRKLNAQIRKLERRRKTFHRKFIRKCRKEFKNKLKSKEHHLEMEFNADLRQAEHNHLREREKFKRKIRSHFEKLLRKEKSKFYKIFNLNKRKLEKNVKKQQENIEKEKRDFTTEKEIVVSEFKKRERTLLKASARLKKRKEKFRKKH